jgi:cytochrome d ubiquinol oxidase subunit I
MVGLGMLMIATGLVALVLHFKKQLFTTRWFHLWCVAMTPAGFVAVLGRLVRHRSGPATVHRVQRIAYVGNHLAGGRRAHRHSPWPPLSFTYGLVFTAGAYYILKLIGKGPESTMEDTYGSHGVKQPPLVTDLAAGTGGKDV